MALEDTTSHVEPPAEEAEGAQADRALPQGAVVVAREGAPGETPAPASPALHLLPPRDPNALQALLTRQAPAPRIAPAPATHKAPTMPPRAAAAPSRKRRGKAPDPHGKRAMRTYVEWVARAKASGDPADLAEATEFGRAAGFVMSEGPHGFAMSDSSAENAPAEARVPDAARGTGGAQQPAQGTSGAEPVPAVAPSEANPAEKPAPALFMGQPVARVEMYAAAVSPAVEALANLVRAMGVDCTAAHERVLFRGTPLQRTLTADPLGRITELLAVEASERFTPKEGAPGERKSDRRAELAVLCAAVGGPAVLPLLGAARHLPGKVLNGVKRAVALLRGRR
jgi:hypothetical protein